MPKAKRPKITAAPTPGSSVRGSNKLLRQQRYVRLKVAQSAAKRKERFDRKKVEAKDPSLREDRLAKNIPQTVDTKRVWDETVPGAVTASESTPADQAADEQAETEETTALFPTLAFPPQRKPHILITTSRYNHTHEQAAALAQMFPNTVYTPRNNDLSIKQICRIASSPSSVDPSTGQQREPFTHVILANVDAKRIDTLTFIILPSGPSFKFSLSNYVPASRISGHGRPTSHIPELIINNFLTPLGRSTAELFRSLFPQIPELRGRQVVTLHNQRDFIFFRRHRYVFREKKDGEKEVGYGLDPSKPGGGKGMEGLGVKVGLQELGPRFTLKLRRVQRGVQEGIVWEWKAGMEKVRTKFNL